MNNSQHDTLDPAWWCHLTPSSLPETVEQWRVLETHISVILLTGSFAYKFKKPVSFGFLDYSTLQQRHECCLRELEINRRYSSEIYDSLWVVWRDPEGEYHLRPEGDRVSDSWALCDYGVCMKQFPDQALLADQLKCGLPVETMDELAVCLADWHQRLPLAHWTDQQFAEITERWTEENFQFMIQHLDDATDIHEIAEWTRQQWQALKSRLVQRQANGWVRQCHGDLHLENVLYWKQQFQLFDGIEFQRELSDIDVINDLAFLLMELSEHGYRQHARRLLSVYLERTEDYEALAELRYYLVYRAMVRAKVDLIRQLQTENGQRSDFSESGKQYLAFAQRMMERSQPRLFLMHGWSGSGKSTVAMRLVQQQAAIRLRSDWVRKRLAGKSDPMQKTDASEVADLYSSASTEATYGELLRQAECVLQAGYSVVVDATFLSADRRRPFLDLTDRLQVRAQIVHCQASGQQLEQRLRLRGTDPSDATMETVRRQQQVSDSWTSREQAIVIDASEVLADCQD